MKSLQAGFKVEEHFIKSGGGVFFSVLSIYSLMIPFLTSPAPCRPPPVLPLPLPPSSSFCNAGALLSFV